MYIRLIDEGMSEEEAFEECASEAAAINEMMAEAYMER